ncbi:DUF4292 domain-containing protein [Mucilaginibacter sp. UR6-11]|uniref:DUF4292 domain-containing protein n=1 Tax=Mucilaginibacter sp. UR6-11 TaxID=1435644 RepID=UPI001E3EBB70|nr:DUF4292 domain-containing protein [Mucilaginibacter sp. UR6-11]MCC8425226.1 DUF4292 domain-containing protein [Mucilaginibacter sp. UR6-11]
MKKNIVNRILIVCCLLVMVSCKARKKVITPIAPITTTISSPEVTNTVKIPTTPPDLTYLKNQLVIIKSHQVNFNTFSGRAGTKLDVNGNSNDVTLNIRISHDKKIWVSVTALLGIEVARALITPDSIKIINKLQGLYLKKPFSYIYQYASRQVNYKTIESLLVGNAMPEILTENTTIRSDMGNMSLTGNLQDLVYSLILGTNLRVTQFNLSNVAAGQALLVNNSSFIQASNRLVPSQIDILSTIGDKKIQANLRYNKVEFDQQLDFPFNIPERYAPAD